MSTFDLSAITFEFATTLTVNSNFTIVSTGAPFDPDNVTLYLRDPLGNLFIIPNSSLTHMATGVFSYVLTPEIAGGWTYKFQGESSGLDVTTPDLVFFVNPSPAMGVPAMSPPYYGPPPPKTPIACGCVGVCTCDWALA